MTLRIGQNELFRLLIGLVFACEHAPLKIDACAALISKHYQALDEEQIRTLQADVAFQRDHPQGNCPAMVQASWAVLLDCIRRREDNE